MKTDEETLEKVKNLKLPERHERNENLVYSCHGDGVRADSKFNIKIYRGKKGMTLVTNDEHTLKCLINGEQTKPENVERVISIDDSGVGFLLGGVLCGVHDSMTDRITTAVIGVRHFQGESRKKQQYLDAYAKEAVKIVRDLNPDKKTTLIRICTGHVNTKAKDALRKLGYCVEVCEIKGKLQELLEDIHMKYLRNTYNFHGYIDPKESTPKQLAIEFHKLKSWVIRHNMQHCCKSDWGL